MHNHSCNNLKLFVRFICQHKIYEDICAKTKFARATHEKSNFAIFKIFDALKVYNCKLLKFTRICRQNRVFLEKTKEAKSKALEGIYLKKTFYSSPPCVQDIKNKNLAARKASI